MSKVAVLVAVAVLGGAACNWVGYDVQDSTGRWWKQMNHKSDGVEKGRLRYKVGSTNYFDRAHVRASQLVGGCVYDYLEPVWCVGQPSPLLQENGTPVPIYVVNY